MEESQSCVLCGCHRSHAGEVQLASEQVLMGQDCVDGECGRLSCGSCARQCSAGLYKKCLSCDHWSP